MKVGRMARGEAGFALTLVLITSLLIGLVGIGVFSVVLSDLHGAVANQLAMQVLNTAEAGVSYALSELFARASQPSATCASGYADECWPPSSPIGPIAYGNGAYQVTVACGDRTALTASGCPDDPTTADDERNIRLIISTGTIGRARREIHVVVRRGPSGGGPFAGVCGRRGVELDQGTSIAADVASSRNIVVEGPRRNPGTIRALTELTTSPATAPTAVGEPVGSLGLIGTYSWRVTFVDTNGAESLGSPASATLSLTNQNARLTGIPLGGAGIVKRRIYRTRAGQESSGPWWFSGEIRDNTTQAFDDTGVDAELILGLAGSANPPAPSVAPSVAVFSPPPPPGLSGTYTYKVTYVYRYPDSTIAEIESLGGPGSLDVTLSNEYGKITNLPQDSNPAILKRRMYRQRTDVLGSEWLFVVEIAAGNDQLDDLNPDPTIVERGYIDKKSDDELRYVAPELFAGNASANRAVTCSQGCPTQVDGQVRENVREVLCPAFVPPPCDPNPANGNAPLSIAYSDGVPRAGNPLVRDLRYDELHPAADARVTVTVPDNPGTELHIHVTQMIFERDVRLSVSGKGKIYFHVQGQLSLGQRSWLGIDDAKPGDLLVWPGDRIQILSCAVDPEYDGTGGTASVWWHQQNRVAALVFAPRANILINQAGEFRGGLYGQYIHINQGLGYVLDPGRGIDDSLARTAFQIIDRWYDNPRF